MPVSKSAFIFSGGGAALLVSVALNVWQYRERAEMTAAVERTRQEVAAGGDRARKQTSVAVEMRRESSSVPSSRAVGESASLSLSPAAGPVVPAPKGLPAGLAISAANQAIGNYLGEPVAPPANLDPKYTAVGMTEAFLAWCAARGIKVQKLAVDTSEFPFLVYGQMEASPDITRQFNTEMRNLPGYAYGGSVTGRTREGSTYFSLNMMPSSAYPKEQAEAIQRRLMLRLGMLGAIWTDPAP